MSENAETVRNIIFHAARKDYVVRLSLQEKNIRILDYIKQASKRIYSSKNILINDQTFIYLPAFTKSSKPVAQYRRFEFSLDNIFFITDDISDAGQLRTDSVHKRTAERRGDLQRYELVTGVVSDEFLVIIADIHMPSSGELTQPKGSYGFINTSNTTIFRVRYKSGEDKKDYAILYRDKNFIAVNYQIVELAVPFRSDSLTLGAMLMKYLKDEREVFQR